MVKPASRKALKVKRRDVFFTRYGMEEQWENFTKKAFKKSCFSPQRVI
jgi:hypothetical protein